LLAYDGQGFWLATKRLSKGRFKWWPSGSEPGWLAESVSNRWGPFGINSEALAEYEKKHPAQSPVNTVVGAPVFH
jgi:hypothetical protein